MGVRMIRKEYYYWGNKIGEDLKFFNKMRLRVNSIFIFFNIFVVLSILWVLLKW